MGLSEDARRAEEDSARMEAHYRRIAEIMQEAQQPQESPRYRAAGLFDGAMGKSLISKFYLGGPNFSTLQEREKGTTVEISLSKPTYAISLGQVQIPVNVDMAIELRNTLNGAEYWEDLYDTDKEVTTNISMHGLPYVMSLTLPNTGKQTLNIDITFDETNAHHTFALNGAEVVRLLCILNKIIKGAK